MSDPSERAPLRLYETTVRPEWVDYNGHMSEAFYVLIFGYATNALLEEIGAGSDYRERTGNSVYTLEAHVSYVQEVAEGEPLTTTTQILEFDQKRLRVFHCMYHARSGELLATEELMLIHVDTAKARSASFDAGIHDRLEAFHKEHAQLPMPERAGRSIALRR